MEGLLELGHLYMTKKKDDEKALVAYREALAAAPDARRAAVLEQIPAALRARL